jgi:hypothetical protein
MNDNELSTSLRENARIMPTVWTRWGNHGIRTLKYAKSGELRIKVGAEDLAAKFSATVEGYGKRYKKWTIQALFCTDQLRKAAIIIDVQKKLGTLLGWPLPTEEEIDKLL